MKKLVLALAALLLLPAQGFGLDSNTWLPFDTKGSPGRILDMVYGSRIDGCTFDANADLFSTTVDQDSNSAQTTLYVAATTDVAQGDVLLVNDGGAREEVCLVSSVSAGDHVVCTANLTYTHTAVQADAVVVTNRLPATGTAGFTAGAIYVIGCFDSTGAGVACECVQGDSTANGTTIGETFYAGEKQAWRFKTGKTFLSCIPYADDAIIQVCKLNY